MRVKKYDFFTMTYQFFGAGIVVWTFVLEESGKITGYAISTSFININWSLFSLLGAWMVGILGLVIQREIYVHRQIKQEISKYETHARHNY